MIQRAAAGYDRLLPLSYINPVNLMDAVNVPGVGWKNKWAHETGTVFHMLWNTHQQRQRLAAKYGDPDTLLKQTWNPDQDPRFR